MKSVPIHELKKNLASFVSAAEGGERIMITRHHKPVAAMTSAGSDHLVVGPRSMKAGLRPVLHHGSRGKFLSVLAEDRRGGPADR